jgi:cell division transport system permease protein
MASAKKTSYFYAILGITLVLFVAGIGGAIIIEAERFTRQFKEDISVEIVLKSDLQQPQINSVQAALKAKKFVRQVKLITKEEAAKLLQNELGADYLDVLGYNPLYASFVINLNETYTSKELLESSKEELLKIEGVEQVNMPISIIDSINKKIKTFSYLILLLSGLLMLIAVSLIFSTIRLAVFSNRFIIKTEQLFGATRWFIIKPYLGRGILNGLLGGLLAVLLVGALLFYLNYTMPDLALETDLISFALLFAALIFSGIMISFLSTLLAVLRYLKMKLDELY